MPALERHHDVFAPTLPGHAGGPPVAGDLSTEEILDALEETMDGAGLGRAHLVGNSLGGYLALRLAARDRAESVVALAPAGGWAAGDPSAADTLRHFTAMHELLRAAAPHADAIASSRAGRRHATQLITSRFDHIPAALVAHLIGGAAGCRAVGSLTETARREGWTLAADRVTCPVRVIWGTADRLLPWPAAAARLRADWLPQADWVELDGVGHCPQLDVPLETAQLILGFTAQVAARPG